MTTTESKMLCYPQWKGRLMSTFAPAMKGETILKRRSSEMDSIYNVSVTFWDLNTWIYGLKQGMNEPIKSYYERMADISIKLEQYHRLLWPGRIKSDEEGLLLCRAKGTQYLVSHMKDHDQYRPAQMLKEIQEQEDSCYTANTAPKPQPGQPQQKIWPNTAGKAHHMIRLKLTLSGTQMYSSRTRNKMSPIHP